MATCHPPPSGRTARRRCATAHTARAGGCERLADGTVLISDAQAGRALIVDRDGRERWQVRVSTSTTGARSRAEFYRLSAIPDASARHLGTRDRPARALTESRVRCQLVQTVRSTL
ncbi:hypothetical protein ACFWAP_12255 [Streptomyces goshikiensis]|uniref:hypothetical protein n=1 Tax=Streptomyces goshikiensis TaxID=1942 RepID=UPI003657F966